jgi:hypothetical protein
MYKSGNLGLGNRPSEQKSTSGRTGHNVIWQVDGNHVLPVNDLRQHSVTDCWCHPADDDGIVVHNSLDRRELYERGDKKLS